jgi:hypothetical protein
LQWLRDLYRRLRPVLHGKNLFFARSFAAHSFAYRNSVAQTKFGLTRERSRQISFASFPYGSATVTPFAYELNITTRNLTKKTNSDIVWEPILAFIPPTLLIKSISDLGSNSAADTATGIRFSEAYSYCTLENSCNPDFSLGRCWGWWVTHRHAPHIPHRRR